MHVIKMPSFTDVITRFCALFGVFIVGLMVLGYTEAAGWVDLCFMLFFIAFVGCVLRPLCVSEGDKQNSHMIA
jgi:hypothetical protein